MRLCIVRAIVTIGTLSASSRLSLCAAGSPREKDRWTDSRGTDVGCVFAPHDWDAARTLKAVSADSPGEQLAYFINCVVDACVNLTLVAGARFGFAGPLALLRLCLSCPSSQLLCLPATCVCVCASACVVVVAVMVVCCAVLSVCLLPLCWMSV